MEAAGAAVAAERITGTDDFSTGKTYTRPYICTYYVRTNVCLYIYTYLLWVYDTVVCVRNVLTTPDRNMAARTSVSEKKKHARIMSPPSGRSVKCTRVYQLCMYDRRACQCKG